MNLSDDEKRAVSALFCFVTIVLIILALLDSYAK